MRQAHAGLEITPRQFTAMARHLTTALVRAGIPAELVREIAGHVERLRDDIVGAERPGQRIIVEQRRLSPVHLPMHITVHL